MDLPDQLRTGSRAVTAPGLGALGLAKAGVDDAAPGWAEHSWHLSGPQGLELAFALPVDVEPAQAEQLATAPAQKREVIADRRGVLDG